MTPELESEAPEGSDDVLQEPESGVVLLIPERLVPPGSDCAAGFVAPGERVRLVAEGFAPNSTVDFVVEGVSLPGTVLSVVPIPSGVADDRGRVEVQWAVPDAPASEVDPAPRVYFVAGLGTAGGSGELGFGGGVAAGAALEARMPKPFLAYPGVVPCAVADAAVVALGGSVSIEVLANDVAPYGGSLDAASVRMERHSGGGDFVVDETDGSVIFVPDGEVLGEVTATYWVSDSWGVGVRGEITATVEPGCTITGVAGETEIVGTDGDDVICVPDPSRRSGFYVIEAKGGDDVILGSDGMDWIYAGPGRDTIYARDGNDIISSGGGGDTIYSGWGRDSIYSPDLSDQIIDNDGYELNEPLPEPQPCDSSQDSHQWCG